MAREVIRVCLSDNGRELYLYSDDGKSLEAIFSVTDFAGMAEMVKEAAESEYIDDFEARHGVSYMRCPGKGYCAPGECDDHYEDHGSY
jgi:hypothetical protein